MVEWVCRRKPCCVLIEDTFNKAYFEDWQLVKDGQNYDPVGDATIPFAASSTSKNVSLVRTIFRRVPRLQNLRNYCSPCGNDANYKHEQLWDPWDTSSLPKSSWQAVGEPYAPTWKFSGTQGTSAFWEKSEAPLPHQKTCAIFFTQSSTVPFPTA